MRSPRTLAPPPAGRLRAPGTRAPLALAVPALVAIAFLLMPLVGVLARTPGTTSAPI